MIERFFPRLLVDGIQDISLDILSGRGIKGLILDIDSTLVPSRVKDADENAVQWMERVKSRGFKVCIVSNASKKRVIRFNERLKVFAIHRAKKPSRKAFMKAARLLDMPANKIAVVGDQIFTDIYGGNRLGMFTVLVKPLDKREFFFIKFKRVMEKYILAKYRKRIREG